MRVVAWLASVPVGAENSPPRGGVIDSACVVHGCDLTESLGVYLFFICVCGGFDGAQCLCPPLVPLFREFPRSLGEARFGVLTL